MPLFLNWKSRVSRNSTAFVACLFTRKPRCRVQYSHLGRPYDFSVAPFPQQLRKLFQKISHLIQNPQVSSYTTAERSAKFREIGTDQIRVRDWWKLSHKHFLTLRNISTFLRILYSPEFPLKVSILNISESSPRHPRPALTQKFFFFRTLMLPPCPLLKLQWDIWKAPGKLDSTSKTSGIKERIWKISLNSHQWKAAKPSNFILWPGELTKYKLYFNKAQK